MNLGISFAPLAPAYIVWGAVAVACALSLLLVLARTRAGVFRAIALALFVLALANPSFTREDRDPLTSVVRGTGRILDDFAKYGNVLTT